MAEHPPLYLKGIELFNQKNFFDCHDAWEELWLEVGPPRGNFLKGLIQAAVALYHLESGNLQGAVKLYQGQKKYLTPYLPKMMDLELAPFLAAMDRAFENALIGKIEFDPNLAPTIQLVSP